MTDDTTCRDNVVTALEVWWNLLRTKAEKQQEQKDKLFGELQALHESMEQTDEDIASVEWALSLLETYGSPERQES